MANILVVDDRPINREFLVALLGYAGHAVLQATDGQQALQIVRERRPDLVISDVLTPVCAAKFLKLMKCDEMQGYLYSLPMPAEQCAALLGKNLGPVSP